MSPTTSKHEVTGTEHDGLCEECGEELTEENLVETSRGFYCSNQCRMESESEGGPWYDYREDFHSDG
jgi:hypothetical protein